MARTSARDIVRENTSLREWRGFPEDAIAIADNGSGDALVIFKADGSYGDAVYLWQHETSALEEVGTVADLVA